MNTIIYHDMQKKKTIQQKGAVTFSEPFCISCLSVLGRETLDSSLSERDLGGSCSTAN